MKTLDEVIMELKTIYDRYEAEGCFYCSFQRECVGSYCYLYDALHYLKEYRSDQIQWEADREDWRDKWESYIEARERHLDAVKELKRNDLLTWDELRTMEGKPVLVEWISGTWKGLHKWILIRRIEDLIMEFTALDVARVSYDGNLQKYCLGKTWQAYRKERE